MNIDTTNRTFPFDSFQYEPSYRAIQKIYKDQTTFRTGVPLINHINEGLKILGFLGADYATACAYCLHPITQNDESIKGIFELTKTIHPEAIVLALEYRYAANSYLRKITRIDDDTKQPKDYFPKPSEYRPSVFPKVKMMLVADKIQNRKDFDIHHKETHPDSAKLVEYFNNWMTILGISETEYQQVIAAISLTNHHP